MHRAVNRMRRAEGLSEYVVIFSLIMVCSVSTLLTAGSRSLRAVASERSLCTIQGDGRNCDNLIKGNVNDPYAPTDPASAGPDGAADPANPADPNAPAAGTTAPAPTSWLASVFGLNGGGWGNDFLMSLFGIFAWF